MTTTVTIDAHAGWPVKVTQQDKIDGAWKDAGERNIPALGQERISVWENRRIIVEEMKKE